MTSYIKYYSATKEHRLLSWAVPMPHHKKTTFLKAQLKSFITNQEKTADFGDISL